MKNQTKKYESYECTALCLDIRNFTPTLEKYPTEEFYELLHNVYCAGFNIANCLAKKDKNKHFYINSTGDGFICVFFDDSDHYIKAYLMGILLLKKLPDLLNKFYSNKKDISCDTTYKFGIGIESGSAVRIKTSGRINAIETLIGDAINLAARIESKTKEYTDSPLIYGEVLNQKLSLNIFGKDYDSLTKKAQNPSSEEELNGVNSKMNEINASLLSDYLHKHCIKGHKPGERLYKLSISMLKNLDINNWSVLSTTKMPATVSKVFKRLWKITDIWDLEKIPQELYMVQSKQGFSKAGAGLSEVRYPLVEIDSKL